MSLVLCKKCGRTLLSSAESCMDCGQPLRETHAQATRPAEAGPRFGKLKRMVHRVLRFFGK